MIDNQFQYWYGLQKVILVDAAAFGRLLAKRVNFFYNEVFLQ
jgi:hypothetical protein